MLRTYRLEENMIICLCILFRILWKSVLLSRTVFELMNVISYVISCPSWTSQRLRHESKPKVTKKITSSPKKTKGLSRWSRIVAVLRARGRNSWLPFSSVRTAYADEQDQPRVESPAAKSGGITERSRRRCTQSERRPAVVTSVTTRNVSKSHVTRWKIPL